MTKAKYVIEGYQEEDEDEDLEDGLWGYFVYTTDFDEIKGDQEDDVTMVWQKQENFERLTIARMRMRIELMMTRAMMMRMVWQKQEDLEGLANHQA